MSDSMFRTLTHSLMTLSSVARDLVDLLVLTQTQLRPLTDR